MPPDDPEGGPVIAVHHRTGGFAHGLGPAIRVTAIHLPAVVVAAPADPDERPVTLDVRTTGFVRLTPELVAAPLGQPARAG